MRVFNPEDLQSYQYIFFTGKGGVGKTSAASASAVALAEIGKKILLVSTDPASNLQDLFELKASNEKTEIESVKNLYLMNLDPIVSAEKYKESVVAPYRGILPDVAIQNMEEQLSGSCTVEVAAFNEFTTLLADELVQEEFDHIIFDTAPTGHTLRMLELPSAWTSFLDQNTSGASCLGQLSGLTESREVYKGAVEVLKDKKKTKMVLVTRPDRSPLLEAARASKELKELGVINQLLLVNGLITEESPQGVLELMKLKQEKAWKERPEELDGIETASIPLRSYAMDSVENIRRMLTSTSGRYVNEEYDIHSSMDFQLLLEEIRKDGTRVLFTMGKGGVGKTTIASAMAMYFAKNGVKVHLTTTDPANHLTETVHESENLKVSFIDEEEELRHYKEEVLKKAEGASEEDLAYIEEDLRSPCTQEIAIFRKFAEIVHGSGEELLIIDTAPTGHTLLLLDSTESYHKEVERSQGEIPEAVRTLLPRLRNKKETKVFIVSLPEPTPFYEAKRLKEDLIRAGIHVDSWILNQTLEQLSDNSLFVREKQKEERKWANLVFEEMEGRFVMVPWSKEELKGETLLQLIP